MKHRDGLSHDLDGVRSADKSSRLVPRPDFAGMDRREFARRAAVLGIGVPSLASFIAACGGDSGGSTATTGGTSGGGGNLPKTAVVTQLGPVLSLDPDGVGELNKPSQTAFLSGYDGLTLFRLPLDEAEVTDLLAEGAAGLVVPRLAESWETAKGGKLYRFNLQADVVSEYGNTMTADDVVWSVQKCFANESSGAFVLGVIGSVPGPEAVKAVDDLVVEFSLSKPSDWILLALGWHIGGGLVIHDSTEVKKHVTKKDPYGSKWLSRNIAGFGPYKITENDPSGNKLTFEARDDYWGEPPTLKNVVQQSVPEEGSRLQLLLTGQSVMSFQMSPSQLDKVEESNTAKVERVATAVTTTFLPLTFEGAWGDPEVRQAIAKVIPYQSILDTILRGRATPYQSVLLPYLPGFTDEFAIEEDVEAAKSVLSGVKDKLTLTYVADAEVDEQVALLLQTAMREAGFDLGLQKQPYSEFNTKRYDGGNAFWIESRAAPGLAAVDYYLNCYVGDPKTVGFYNFFGYQNDEMDDLVQTITAGDPQADDVLEATRRAQEIFMGDMVFIPIAWIGENYPVSNQVEIPFAYSGNGSALWRDLLPAKS